MNIVGDYGSDRLLGEGRELGAREAARGVRGRLRLLEPERALAEESRRLHVGVRLGGVGAGQDCWPERYLLVRSTHEGKQDQI